MPGILHADTAHRRFRFTTQPPAGRLAPFVTHYWVIHWDLRGQPPHEQHVLPYPAVNMTFLPGRCRITGVPRGRFAEVLTGTGRVVGVRFRPTGFRPFLGAPVWTLTDRFRPVEAVFGADGAALAEAVLAADEAGAVGSLDRFLADRAPDRPDAVAETVDGIVARAAGDTAITRVDQLVDASGVGARTMQRLFADYVGVGPKWVIRRYRLHEAAAAAESAGGGLDVAALAASLGYADQAHLTRDFTAVVGEPPARYARAQPGPA